MESTQGRNHKVAIIGAGPVGIGLALMLLKEGFIIDIYEKRAVT